MKKIYFLLFALAFTVLSFGQTAAGFPILINEFQPNANGTDPDPASFEIKGLSGQMISGWIISLECDPGTNAGKVDRAHAFSGTFDANDLLLITDMPDLENPSFTVLITSSFSGAIGDDLDADDDGTIDAVSPFGTVWDAIGIADSTGDEALLYGDDFGGANLAYTGDEPQLVFRNGDTDAWYAINDPDLGNVFELTTGLAGTPLLVTDFATNPLATTFGAKNPILAVAGIQEDAIEGFEIYPNPVSNGTMVISSLSTEVKNISLYNILGKQVLSNEISGNEAEINVSNLSAGVYVLKLTENNKVATRKVIIQ